jgi:hypothetical protein
MATLKENSDRYYEIRRIVDHESLPKEKLMGLLREGIQKADAIGFTDCSREFKDRLNWLMKSHEQQRAEISSYWQPE